METEVRKLRATLADARADVGIGRAGTPAQITAVGRRLRDEGQSWFRIGREIGPRLERLCEAAPSVVAADVVDDVVAWTGERWSRPLT